ncbi:MAG: hypothetical protein RB292_01080 [Patescibacteria group bacterium]|jgi:hypothetical protein|nr:hypothetical protein [Patescibacteria group bacterium]
MNEAKLAALALAGLVWIGVGIHLESRRNHCRRKSAIDQLVDIVSLPFSQISLVLIELAALILTPAKPDPNEQKEDQKP